MIDQLLKFKKITSYIYSFSFIHCLRVMLLFLLLLVSFSHLRNSLLLIDQLLFYKMDLSLLQSFIANRLMLSRKFHRIIRLIYQSVQADQ